MSTWRRPFILRLLAGLLVAALIWALLPTHAQAHGDAAHREGGGTLVQALTLAPHEAGPGLPCGPQAACAPTFVLQPVATTAFVASWHLVRVRAWDDRRTHLHRHAHEPPPPRLRA